MAMQPVPLITRIPAPVWNAPASWLDLQCGGPELLAQSLHRRVGFDAAGADAGGGKGLIGGKTGGA